MNLDKEEGPNESEALRQAHGQTRGYKSELQPTIPPSSNFVINS